MRMSGSPRGSPGERSIRCLSGVVGVSSTRRRQMTLIGRTSEAARIATHCGAAPRHHLQEGQYVERDSSRFHAFSNTPHVDPPLNPVPCLIWVRRALQSPLVGVVAGGARLPLPGPNDSTQGIHCSMRTITEPSSLEARRTCGSSLVSWRQKPRPR